MADRLTGMNYFGRLLVELSVLTAYFLFGTANDCDAGVRARFLRFMASKNARPGLRIAATVFSGLPVPSMKFSVSRCRFSLSLLWPPLPRP